VNYELQLFFSLRIFETFIAKFQIIKLSVFSSMSIKFFWVPYDSLTHDSLTPRFTDTTIDWHHDSLTPRFTDNTKSVEIHIWGPATNTKCVWIHIWSPTPNTKNLGSEGYRINKIWGFCSNMDLSDHAYILHTGVSEGEEFNE
jgi:hypothetical protein